MATTIETEAEDLQLVQKREPSANPAARNRISSGVSSRRFSRWILLLSADRREWSFALVGALQNYESTRAQLGALGPSKLSSVDS